MPASLSERQRHYLYFLFSGIDICIVILMLFLPVKFLIGDRWAVVAVGNSFLTLFIMGAVLYLPVALLRRKWKAVLASSAAALFFVVSYGGLFISQSIAVPANALEFTILTYNIHSESDQDTLDSMMTLIRSTGADVVALQEVGHQAATIFTANLNDLYPYHAFHTSEDEPVIGQGVLSRYPVLDDDYWRNDQLPIRLAHQKIVLQIRGQVINLYNTHPIHPILKAGQLFYTELRTTEIQSVLDRARKDTGAVIIAGDFNMSDQSDDYRHITTTYQDTFREVGWWMGFTFPDFLSPGAAPGGQFALPVRPLVRLDYIFHSDDLIPVQAQVWRSSGGSDHRPVLATFALPG